jgi:anti-sigma B factor antagonist
MPTSRPVRPAPTRPAAGRPAVSGADRPTPALLALAADWPAPRVCVVRPTGVLDSATAPRFAEFLREQAALGARDLVLDLAGVRLLAAAGVTTIIGARLDRLDVGGRLHLTGVTGNRAVAKVLALTGVGGLVEVHDELGSLLARLDAE